MPRGIPKWLEGLTKEEQEQTKILLALEKEERDKAYRKHYYQQKKFNKILSDPPCTFTIQHGNFFPFRDDHIRAYNINAKFDTTNNSLISKNNHKIDIEK
tara:strand:- start:123 stop:422 length:300 start_codon:yes stop_codon:yes gene_type:complete